WRDDDSARLDPMMACQTTHGARMLDLVAYGPTRGANEPHRGAELLQLARHTTKRGHARRLEERGGGKVMSHRRTSVHCRAQTFRAPARGCRVFEHVAVDRCRA